MYPKFLSPQSERRGRSFKDRLTRKVNEAMRINQYGAEIQLISRGQNCKKIGNPGISDPKEGLSPIGRFGLKGKFWCQLFFLFFWQDPNDSDKPIYH